MKFFLAKSLVAVDGISKIEDYQKNSSLQQAWALKGLESFPIADQDSVLDVGCGDGKITASIANEMTKGLVVGIDISNAMIKLAKSTYKSDNLIFCQGNATSIPYEGQFDKLISFSVLHWVVDQKGALQSMKASLKPGGMMLLVVPGRSPTSTSLLGEKLTRRDKWVKFFPNFKLDRVYFTVDEYRSLLEEVGLEVDSITQFETVAFFKNKESLIDWIRPLVNFIDHLDAEQQAAFLEEIVDEILLVYPENSDGSIQPHHLTTKVIARKGS